MPAQPFRFIHAARLLLDHQFSGVGQLTSTGALPQKLRSIAEEAAVLAFQHVIDACITHDVDFLLLAGDSFDDADEGIRGQVSLLEGLERLCERGIDVFIIAGARDPWKAWLSGMRLPRNVHLVHAGTEPFSIEREESTLATIAGFATAGDEVRQERDPRGGLWPSLSNANSSETSGANTAADCAANPLTIGMAYLPLAENTPADEVAHIARITSQLASAGPIGYWALGGSAIRVSVPMPHGQAHDPGSTQGFCPEDIGPRGCSLVEVDAQGNFRTLFLPTAPIRWEVTRLTVTPETDRETLIETMVARLREIPVYPADQAWLVEWDICGTGSLLDALREPQFRDELMAAVRALPVAPHVEIWARSWKLGNGATAESTPVNRLAAEYFSTAAQKCAPGAQMLRDCLERSDLNGGPWESRLALLAEGLDRDEIRQRVQGLGQSWFTPGE